MVKISCCGLFLILIFPCPGSELASTVLPVVRFKDGTILKNAKIHMGANGEWRPRADGLTLEIDGRIYFHHYPYTVMNRTFAVPVSDDGKYRVRYEKRTYRVPTPRPPVEQHWNPNSIPACAPSRIRFIHFDANTLNAIYKIIDAATKHYEKDSESVLSHHYRAVRDSIRENAWHKLRPDELNTPARSINWQNKVEKEMHQHWKKIYYGKWKRRD